MDDILVSINCITYNHEKYIAKAIEGFLMQKTSFKYEIIIGDDCSTDKTQEIVRDYINRYPGKIKLITDIKNVGAKQNSNRIFNSSIGKYIAICEGDDYWIDENKLERQAMYMVEHPDCSLCFHNAKKYDDLNKIFLEEMINLNINSKEMTIADYFDLKFIPTASMLIRRDVRENTPEFYQKGIVGDLPLNLIAYSKGNVYYMQEVMSIYRVNNINSMMNQWKLTYDSISKKVEHFQKYIYIFEEFNKYSNYKFKREIDREIARYEFYKYSIQGNWKKLKEVKYKDFIDEIKWKEKVKIKFIGKFPKMYEKLVRLKYKNINGGK